MRLRQWRGTLSYRHTVQCTCPLGQRARRMVDVGGTVGVVKTANNENLLLYRTTIVSDANVPRAFLRSVSCDEAPAGWKSVEMRNAEGCGGALIPSGQQIRGCQATNSNFALLNFPLNSGFQFAQRKSRKTLYTQLLHTVTRGLTSSIGSGNM